MSKNMKHYTSKISSSGQINVPKSIRDELKLETGDFLSFSMKNGEIVLTPVTMEPIRKS